jgi:Xaa-Pro aminopeptidase
LEEFRKCVFFSSSILPNSPPPIVELTYSFQSQMSRQLPLFHSLSFSTISSTGPNASVIHYSPPSSPPNSSAIIDPSQIYLCDSGSQFLDGTTEYVSFPRHPFSTGTDLFKRSVTRTHHFSTPTSFEKLAYTRVLQGHIALAEAVFPETTSGYQLDLLARGALWKEGLD